MIILALLDFAGNFETRNLRINKEENIVFKNIQFNFFIVFIVNVFYLDFCIRYD